MNIRRVLSITALLVLGVQIAAPAFSHLRYISIDRSVVVAYAATVLHFDWRNPHVYFRIEAVDEKGERV